MSILRDFEKRLEGAVEGFFARAFRSGLQPVELAKAIQRYANNYQQVGMDGIIVPNVYRFVLAENDLERFGGYTTALQRELADVVSRTAEERDWRLKGPVRIEFERGDHVRVGTYELRGKIEAPEARRPAPPAPAPAAAPAPQPASDPAADHAAWAPPPEDAQGEGDDQSPDGQGPGATTVMPAQATTAVVHVLGGQTPPARLRGEAVLGRLPECDVTLADPSVSRRHARITEQGGSWRITDLGSTNGVKVNGERVADADLAHGDRIELGTVRLAFSLEGK
jgi:predicted component of type VI protein secretion system